MVHILQCFPFVSFVLFSTILAGSTVGSGVIKYPSVFCSRVLCRIQHCILAGLAVGNGVIKYHI